MRVFFFALLLASSSILASLEAEARDSDDCMLAWHRAVSSYLTQNRTKFPQDEKMSVFAPACDKEQAGDKSAARVEAIMIGAINLAQLDNRGCRRFMESYAGAEGGASKNICDKAIRGASDGLRDLIKSSIPAK